MYDVYYAVVNVLGIADETKVFRFIVFDNGTTFEFYGTHGSLRHATCIDEDDVDQLKQIQPYDALIHFCGNRNIMYTILSKAEGLLAQYIREKEHIIECGRMPSEQSTAFARSMKGSQHPYATPKAGETFKFYLDVL